MKTIIIFIAFIGAVWALPKITEELQFKGLYADPLTVVPKTVIPKIVNGAEVTPHSIPYQAFISITGLGTRWLCGGSLISTRYVLTAAHCLIGGASATVYLGSHNVDVNEESTRLVITTPALFPHPSYAGTTYSYDIGLIRFNNPIVLTEHINVVNLPSRQGDIDDYVGFIGRVSGWGSIEADAPNSPILLAINSTIISNRICNNYYGVVHDQHVCIAGSQGGLTCHGDSGGPLIVNNVQIGIVSFGTQACLVGYPSVFARTDIYLDWIEQNSDVTF